MKVLIVGAGAVGQVYGYHFKKNGHQVDFLIKEKYRHTLQQGMTLYDLNRDKHLRCPLQFRADHLVSDWPARHAGYDVIIITIPSNALRQLPFDQLREACKQTPLLMLQPSSEDRTLLQQQLPGVVIAEALISLIAYQTPLPDRNGDTLAQSATPEGICFYLPPLAMPVSSESRQLATALRQLFHHSGIKARLSASAIEDSAVPSAFLMTFLCCLEAADWSFDNLSANPQLLKQLAQAQRQLIPNHIPAGIKHRLAQWLSAWLCRPWLYRLLLKLSPAIVPLPLEAYLASHFRKVHQQTRLYMEDYYQQLPTTEIAELLALCRPRNHQWHKN